MRYLFLFLIVLSFASVVSADCEDNQVDINSASESELEELSGIGEKTLEKIELQDLACVEGEDEEINVEVDESSDEETKTSEEEISDEENPKKDIVLTPRKESIILNAEVKDSKEIIYESKNFKILKYTPYAFSIFLIFVIAVLIFDK